MFKWLKRVWREWWGPWDKPKARPAPNLYIVPKQDYAVNQHQLDRIERKLRDGERPRGAA